MIQKDSAAKRLGLEASENGVALSASSLLAGIGGWLGVAETMLPSLAFLISFAISGLTLLSVLVAAGLALGFVSVRLLQRKSAVQALAGALAVALAAWLALRDGGTAVDYFVPGFYLNAAYGLVFLVSILFRYPVLGFLGGALFGIADWRKRAPYLRRFMLLTAMWVVFFGLRLTVQLPLYFANEVELLATSRILMGAPAYAALLALTWVSMRSIARSAAIDRLDT